MLAGKLYSLCTQKCGSGSAEWTVLLNSECDIYKAHFPGNPITPGVCLLECARELLSDALGSNLRIARIRNIKYLALVSPVVTRSITFSATWSDGDEEGQFRSSITVTDADQCFARMSIDFFRQ